ncbi:citrate:proton symporter [[Clostridium] symbiosum]|uniref:CitMHS family transporter n=1 Tax=Clostridium symbiosum TaxID=1512 RepID=UPI001D085F32|nr:citrate:proton symporter [[Clostridium] symbiosum]MCB6611513.1 citrate:proton symporter [[Clostridium] symbiosum]MCB6932916.1 citrate:proton symporter [[Clostridium] symbiosum]
MYLALVGAFMFAAIIYLLMKGKAIPLVVLTLVPIVCCFLAGYNFVETVELIGSGVGSVWKNAALFIFSIIFFGVMSDAGMFDGLISRLTSMAGNNVVAVTVVTVIIGMVGHLDGAGATTVLITVPALMPLYKKMNIRLETLLLLVGVAMTTMNLVPWGGPTMRVATVLGMDVNDLWRQIIPFQIVGAAFSIFVGVIFGVIEKKRGAGFIASSINSAENEDKTGEDLSLKRPKLVVVDMVLTLILMIGLVTGIAPAYILFMLACTIALVINYPETGLQSKLFKRHAPNALLMSGTMLAAGVLVGVVNNTDILMSMVNILVGLLPNFMGKYLHIIVALLALPIGIPFGGDAYYYALFPLLAEIGEPFGIAPVQMGIALLIGKNAGLMASPIQPVTLLGTGMTNISLRDHLAFSFKYLWLISIALVVIAIIMGQITL